MTTQGKDKESILSGIRESYEAWDKEFSCYDSEYSYTMSCIARDYGGSYFEGLCRFMGLALSKNDPNLLAYYETPEKRKEGRRNKIKPGKFIRKYLPFLTDSEVESFVQAFKAKFAPRSYDIIESEDESDFIKAYTHTITQGTSPEYLTYEGFEEVKSLSGSCMRHSFSGLSKHPAAAYASGDFKIIYAQEKETGHIGARVVVGNDSAAPIYTNCDNATKAICDYLLEQDINPDSEWDGLKLAKIPCGGDNYLCPYLDGYSNLEDDDDSFIIGQGGIFFHTQGYVICSPMGMCEECEESIPEDDLYEVHGSVYVCSYCRSNHYTYSRLMGDYIRDDECIEIEGDVATQDWIDDSGEYVFCSSSYEYRDISDCIEYEGEYYATDSGVVYEVEGKYYHEDSPEYQEALEEKETKDRIANEAYQTIKTTTLGWVVESNGYGGPNVYQGWITTKETTLRLNYELDSNGLPYRLPEFNFA